MVRQPPHELVRQPLVDLRHPHALRQGLIPLSLKTNQLFTLVVHQSQFGRTPIGGFAETLHLKGLKLTQLDLGGHHITDASIETLGTLRSLKWLFQRSS